MFHLQKEEEIKELDNLVLNQSDKFNLNDNRNYSACE